MPRAASKTSAKTEAQNQASFDRNLKKFYPEVGRIAAIWAMLEFRMDQLIWDLACVEQSLGACITTQLNGPTPRLRTIKALSSLLGVTNEVMKKIDKFNHAIMKPQEERNRAIHDPWFIGSETKNVYKVTVAIVRNRSQGAEAADVRARV